MICSGFSLDMVMLWCNGAAVQRFTTSLEDSVADGLRIEAARRRCSVAELIRGLVIAGMVVGNLPAAPSGVEQSAENGGGEPGTAGSAEKRPVRVAPTDPVDGVTAPAASPPSSFKPDPKPGR